MQMGYVLAGAVLVLILVIGITLLTLNAKRHGREGKRAAADSDYGHGVPGSDMAIIAEDRDAPLGDTTEHAGEQQDGTTVADQDADRRYQRRRASHGRRPRRAADRRRRGRGAPPHLGLRALRQNSRGPGRPGARQS